MPQPTSGGNGRVLNREILARLDERMNEVMRRLDRNDAHIKDIECKLDFVTANRTKIETLDNRLEKIERSSNRYDALLAFATTIGTTLGIIFGFRK
jgi:hypothetical protein